MAKFLQPGELVDYVPPDQRDKPEDERIVYSVRAPGWAEETSYRRAVAAAGGHRWGALAMLKALEDGVRAVGEAVGVAAEPACAVVAEQRARLEALIAEQAGDGGNGAGEAAQAWLERYFEILERAELLEIESLVRSAYPRYAAMDADNKVYAEIAAHEAARLFLTAWRGAPTAAWGPVERGARGCNEATLARIPRQHRGGLGAFVEGLLGPNEDEAKNSASPSPGDTAPQTSKATSGRGAAAAAKTQA